MLCRQIILAIARKRLIHVGVQASNIACGYVEQIYNSNLSNRSLNHKEIRNRQHNLEIIKRFKSNKKNSKRQKNVENDDEDDNDDDDYDDDDYDDLVQDKTSPVTLMKVQSLRLDLVLKAGLNTARNKIETAFYESNIRLNGRRVLKKSEQVRIGDEIDLVRGFSPENPNFLIVSRVHILNAKENAENISIKFTRNRHLVIENYEDPWKSSGSGT